MAIAQNQSNTTSTVSFKRNFFNFSENQTFILLQRQVLLLFRQPLGYWIFGGALFLISASFTVHYNRFAQVTYNDLSQLSRIGIDLMDYYRRFSFLTLLIFVPVIGVSSISQEREAKTLDLMLTTAIPPLELVFSKVAASVAIILIAIFASSPILALTLSMGGVGPWDVFTLFSVQLFLAVASVSVGIGMGARINNFLLGLVCTYGILMVILFPAYGMVAFGTQNENIARAYPAIIIMLGVMFFLLKGVPSHLTREINKVRPISWRPISIKGVDAQLWTFLGTRDYGTPIQSNENPVYISERERFLAFVTRRDFDAPSLLWLVSIFFFYWALTNPTVMEHLSMIIVLLFVPGIGATMFSGENQRSSWECLRSSLISSSQIFWGKFRLTAGQGLIHVLAFYIPSLIILGFIWLLIGMQKGVSYFQSYNAYPVWMGHVLIIVSIIFLVFFITSLSLLVSSLYKRNFIALMTTYGIVGFVLYGPQFLGMMHPHPGPTLGGDNPMDGISTLLSISHAPFIFNLWPKASTTAKILEINPLFWKLYIAHLVFLAAGTAVCCYLTHSRIKMTDD